MATQKQWHVNCDIQKAHMTNGPLVFSKKKKRQHAPHARMLKDLWKVCEVSFMGTFLMFNLAILVAI